MTTREDLIGFLCGALDEAERERIERALEASETLRAELRLLEAELEPLESLRDVEPPPDDLWQRTCAFVAAHDAARDERPAPVPRDPKRESIGSVSSRWSMYDAVVLAGVLASLAMLFFPAIANSRYTAQVTACQNNLRQLGIALVNYSLHHDGYFVAVPSEGHRAGAGIVGPVLFESGYIDDPHVLLCPSTPQAGVADWQLPTLSELDRATGRRLRKLQRAMGGSYGYNLGVQVDGHFQPPRNQGRDFFALLADAPSLHLAGRQSANHGGRGHNLLYEDGNIRFMGHTQSFAAVDHPFLSDRGYVEPGIDSDDAVLAESVIPPLQ